MIAFPGDKVNIFSKDAVWPSDTRLTLCWPLPEQPHCSEHAPLRPRACWVLSFPLSLYLVFLLYVLPRCFFLSSTFFSSFFFLCIFLYPIFPFPSFVLESFNKIEEESLGKKVLFVVIVISLMENL